MEGSRILARGPRHAGWCAATLGRTGDAPYSHRGTVSRRDCYIAQCLEVNFASQAHTIDETLANLAEAVGLYLEGSTTWPGISLRHRS